ncbi:MAG: nucleotidyl transferase AbiEii/AbiGii toxin family protein [Candidatus Thermoplasmatota archaeon]|nr:nucleotidyl transferase AbiEii/AbiGii toxin family protein [Candidatus Thermoplasmatota archaeon]
MITKIELGKIAEQKHLSPRNTEKDYLLELILYNLTDFRRTLVFKGGTALYKFYNLNRFSEDLDFDIAGKQFNLNALTKKILRGFELTGIQRTLDETTEYHNEINMRFIARGPLYDGSKNSMSRVTLNLSKRERPTLTSNKLLIASYPEIPSFEVNVLDTKEIVAEKIRCIMTREKPRDIYDLWFLCKRKTPIDLLLINKKLKLYKVVFDRTLFLEKIQQKRNMWTQDLKDLIIGTLPPFDDVAVELEEWSKTGVS